MQIATYDEFEKAFLLVPNKQTPIKVKFLEQIMPTYMSETLHKVIIRRSPLETKFFKTRHSFKTY